MLVTKDSVLFFLGGGGKFCLETVIVFANCLSNMSSLLGFHRSIVHRIMSLNKPIKK